MYKNIIKIGVIAVLAITLNACSSKTYKIKQESDKCKRSAEVVYGRL